MFSLLKDGIQLIRNVVKACFVPEEYPSLFDQNSNLVAMLEVIERCPVRVYHQALFPRDIWNLIEDYTPTILPVELHCNVWHKYKNQDAWGHDRPQEQISFTLELPFGEAYELTFNCAWKTFKVDHQIPWNDLRRAQVEEYGVCRLMHCDHTQILNFYMLHQHQFEFIPIQWLENAKISCRRIGKSRKYCSDREGCRTKFKVVNHENVKRALQIVRLVFIQIVTMVDYMHENRAQVVHTAERRHRLHH